MLTCFQLEELFLPFIFTSPLGRLCIREYHEEGRQQNFSAWHEDEEGEGDKLEEIFPHLAELPLIAEGYLVIFALLSPLFNDPRDVLSEDFEAVNCVSDLMLNMLPLVLQPVQLQEEAVPYTLGESNEFEDDVVCPTICNVTDEVLEVQVDKLTLFCKLVEV